MAGKCNSNFLRDPEDVFDGDDADRDEEDQYLEAEEEEDVGDDPEEVPRRESRRSRHAELADRYDDDDDLDSDGGDSGPENVRGARDHPRGNNNSSSRSRREESAAEDLRGKWEEVSVTYRFNGSLSKLSTDPALSKVGLRPDVVGVFECSADQSTTTATAATSSTSTDEEKGAKRSSHHLLGGMYLTSIRSDFPCSVHMSMEGMSGHRKSYTSHGAQGVFTVFPKEASGNMRVPLYEASTSADNSFLKKYPGRNLGNIQEGIIELPKKGLSVIDADHPVIGMYNVTRKARNQTELQQHDENPPGHYTVQTEEATRCVENLRESMEKHLRMLDLYNLKFKFSRAFTSTPAASSASGMSSTGSDTVPWRDPCEVHDGVESDIGKGKVLTLPRNLYFTVLYKYKVV